ncbi:hypothetical protein [Adhaeribacter rhizoryzae]|uniref:Uncharacterized protein n=1 Tax=Adhaeribacter rhizoryzae TaxID=2607907 RepID=A0A5M6D0N0_9BACT|nr:hypothetical protein [Adhaeribacter rhizoryzae]KAA5540606.1 hypothetical protein F0145_22610 [Adhaeribacter rhizoryzae]
MYVELEVDQEFAAICKQIKEENKSEAEWRLIESDSMFQTENYEGGFDATEMEFCFSYYDAAGREYWFQLPLAQVQEIAAGKSLKLYLREAEK